MDKAYIEHLVRDALAKRVLYLPHAVRQMSHPERLITTAEVRRAIENGEIIEDYPNDVRGHSCLIFGLGDDSRPIHVVCSPKEDYLVIITAYLPEKTEWSNDFRVRLKL